MRCCRREPHNAAFIKIAGQPRPEGGSHSGPAAAPQGSAAAPNRPSGPGRLTSGVEASGPAAIRGLGRAPHRMAGAPCLARSPATRARPQPAAGVAPAWAWGLALAWWGACGASAERAAGGGEAQAGARSLSRRPPRPDPIPGGRCRSNAFASCATYAPVGHHAIRGFFLWRLRTPGAAFLSPPRREAWIPTAERKCPVYPRGQRRGAARRRTGGWP